MKKDENIKEKFKQALISTLRVISEDIDQIDKLNKKISYKNFDLIEIDDLKNKEDFIKLRAETDSEALKRKFLETNEPPLCSICGGILKTATISFGQAMPEREMQISQRKAIESDLFICIGTSLAVFPAADLPLLAKETGATLVILNNEPTQMDQYADLVINRDISEVFSEISI